jgi:hypothetical protein
MYSYEQNIRCTVSHSLTQEYSWSEFLYCSKSTLRYVRIMSILELFSACHRENLCVEPDTGKIGSVLISLCCSNRLAISVTKG